MVDIVQEVISKRPREILSHPLDKIWTCNTIINTYTMSHKSLRIHLHVSQYLPHGPAALTNVNGMICDATFQKN